jgi:uncharacterized repeat protein (TIGR03803 family)
LEGSDGALYGATTAQGAAPNGETLGTVFKFNKDGTGYQVLHFFGNEPQDRRVPVGALIEGRDGALYGTTSQLLGQGDHGNTVFKLNKNGSGYLVLHAFDGTPGGGLACLATGNDGVLYGTTQLGGANRAGTVFKLNEDGSGYSVLHHFGKALDGTQPQTSLLLAKDGILYGTTTWGGSAQGQGPGWGTVFKLNRDGSGYQILHDFARDDGDGVFPQGALVEGLDGALYGTTSAGGSSRGTLFRLSKDGSGYRILHTFGDLEVSGNDFEASGIGSPLAGLLLGDDGAFYGTTSGTTIGGFSNGSFYGGAVYRMWPPQTPDLIGVNAVQNSVQVSFAGESGARYQVLRSSDLAHWSLLTTITMPAAGVFSYTDDTPPTAAAFYRAAWSP